MNGNAHAHAQPSRASAPPGPACARCACAIRARHAQPDPTHLEERKVVTTIYYSDPNATLHVGDALDILTTMPEGSADCIVTSPPYWAKRDYGITGQYGHEADPAGYVATLRAVFTEARRVLASDGTCWLNLGDSYSEGNGTPHGLHSYVGHGLVGRRAAGLGSKNLLGLPWRVALALQEDGWIIRNAVVWHKPNAMPESVRDRLNCRYELIFLLAKSRHYWFDLDPIRTPHASGPPARARHEPAAGIPVVPAAAASDPPPAPTGRRSTGRIPGKLQPPAGTARAAATGGTPTAGTLVMSGPFRPGPIGGRTSPPTRSMSLPGAFRPGASRAAWSSIRSVAPARPALPRLP